MSLNTQHSTLNTPRACVLTAPGRGAVAVIRYEGDLERLDTARLIRPRNGRSLPDQPLNVVVFGHWIGTEREGLSPQSAAEEVVVCRVEAAAIEIHCHGGTAAVQRILDDLHSIGAEIVPASEADWLWSSPIEAVCQRVLLLASTRRTALLLHEQTRLWTDEITRLRSMTSDGERQMRIEEIGRWETFALHLMGPWNVVLCGRPNAGKSSLMNAIAGFSRSIVHHVPGTTRDVVTYETAIDGWPVRLSDTAGLRETHDPLEAEGVRRTHSATAAADLVIGIFDLSEPPGPEDERLWSDLPVTALRVGNKSDLGPRWPAERLAALELVSARTGAGVESLLARIADRLVPQLPPPNLPLPMDPAWREWVENK